MTDPVSNPRIGPIGGVVLAGGLARRMGGGDKGERLVAGKPLLRHVLDRARPQVCGLCLNANGDPERFAGYGLPVVRDSVEGYLGPLAGVLAGLEWVADHVPGATHMASFACDAPFFPTDLVDRLKAGLTPDTPIACASSDGRAHPVFALWPVALRRDLQAALVEQGVRKVDVWTARHGIAQVPFPTEPIDPFFNANRPEDLAEAERLMAAP